MIDIALDLFSGLDTEAKKTLSNLRGWAQWGDMIQYIYPKHEGERRFQFMLKKKDDQLLFLVFATRAAARVTTPAGEDPATLALSRTVASYDLNAINERIQAGIKAHGLDKPDSEAEHPDKGPGLKPHMVIKIIRLVQAMLEVTTTNEVPRYNDGEAGCECLIDFVGGDKGGGVWCNIVATGYVTLPDGKQSIGIYRHIDAFNLIDTIEEAIKETDTSDLV